MTTTAARQLCTFTLGDMLFGVDVTHVQEVIRYQEMTNVPLAPRVIRGLINLRGQIVTAIDMRARLGMEPRTEPLPMNVVLRGSDGVVSLLVDEIGDVLLPDEAAYEQLPDTLSAGLREVVGGLYKIEKALLLVVDVEKMLRTSGGIGAGA